ncbi:50S ribosomal protein L10 [Candidatus Woesearchaeota archaeon]|nr:50S ribosomal protein L10 [Candidatus Woesearchaeota archaeon]
MKAHVSEKKKKTVDEFVELLNNYPIIGSVNMENLPAKQLQNIRKSIREDAVLKMTKRRLIKIAFEKSKKDLDKLVPYLKGMPALIFTKENPFKLAMKLEKNKSSAPAKPGQPSPKDIYVKEGPTAFSPGPIISQLSKLGIKTGVENGKIVIKEDSLVCEEGEEISEDLAGILVRLKIEPMEIGLNLVAMYEDGTIYEKDILTIDSKEYLKKIKTSASVGYNLAMFINYPTKDTINSLIIKANRDAKTLAISQDIITSDNITEILSKAFNQLKSLSAKLSKEVLPEEFKNIKEPKQTEEKKEEENKKSEPEKEEKSDEEAAQGLGSLFG